MSYKKYIETVINYVDRQYVKNIIIIYYELLRTYQCGVKIIKQQIIF